MPEPEYTEFNFRIIHWACSCGTSPLRVKVGVTSFGELCAVWKCIKCSKDIMARIPLEQLIADIPSPPEPKALPAPAITTEDYQFLKAMHISLEERDATGQ